MRNINEIIIHCSATRSDKKYTFEQCKRDHKTYNHWKDIGYHYYIERDGTIYVGRSEDLIGAHCKDHNKNSIGICYEGGLNQNGKPSDTRTENQKQSLYALLNELKNRYPNSIILGHRDCSIDLNKDGIITPDEYYKQCPCFDAKTEYSVIT